VVFMARNIKTVDLMRSDAVWPGKYLPKFQVNLLPAVSGKKNSASSKA
jgi:hypothetical protein